MMKFNQGFERIMKSVNCPIIPVHLDRIWGSIFSFERGKFFFKIPKMIPYPITISFGEPLPSQSTAFEVRNKVMELGAASFKYRLSDRLTLPESFWKEARKHPLKFCVADSSGISLNFGSTFTELPSNPVAANHAAKVKSLFPFSCRKSAVVAPKTQL